jgi:hypothetical protein
MSRLISPRLVSCRCCSAMSGTILPYLFSNITSYCLTSYHTALPCRVASTPVLLCAALPNCVESCPVFYCTTLSSWVQSSPVQSSPVCTALPCRVQSSPFLSYIALPCPVQFCLVPHYPVVSSSFQFCPVPHYFVESSLVDYRPVLSRQVCGHHGWWCSTHECFQDMKVLKSTVLKREGAGGET